VVHEHACVFLRFFRSKEISRIRSLPASARSHFPLFQLLLFFHFNF